MALCDQKTFGVFRGDGEQLLTALIKACEAQPVSRKADPAWFGRDLVPWTDDGEVIDSSLEFQSLEGPRHASGSRCPVNAFKHARAPAPRTPDSPQHRKGQQPKRSKPGSPSRSASPGSRTACACPALAASPKPESVPMPTTGLLSRAVVRGRSPSLPKDNAVASFFAYNQVQQLVRPVAA